VIEPCDNSGIPAGAGGNFCGTKTRQKIPAAPRGSRPGPGKMQRRAVSENLPAREMTGLKRKTRLYYPVTTVPDPTRLISHLRSHSFRRQKFSQYPGPVQAVPDNRRRQSVSFNIFFGPMVFLKTYRPKTKTSRDPAHAGCGAEHPPF